MDTQQTVNDNSSDCSIEIFLENVSAKNRDIVSHKKLSLFKGNIKIDLESKICVSTNLNLVSISTMDQKWLDLVEKLCSKSQ